MWHALRPFLARSPLAAVARIHALLPARARAQSTAAAGVPDPGPFSPAPFSSLRLDLTSAPPPADLASFVHASLPRWRAHGVNAVFLKLALPQHAHLLAALCGPGGFEVHHARGLECTIFQWLPQHTPCKVPPYASSQVAVGGVCLDARGRVLLIRERHAPASAWKFPGGMSDLGENIPDCAVREVYEETGVRTRFEGLLALRHMHGAAFGVSDLYCLALLRPLQPHASANALDAEVTIDPGEIAAGAWCDAAHFAATTRHALMARMAREALAVARGQGWVPPAEAGEGVGQAASGSSDSSGFLRLNDLYSAINKKWTQCYIPSAAPMPPFPPETDPDTAPPLPQRAAPWERVTGQDKKKSN